MKFCSMCGSELTEGVKFCSKCGTNVDALDSVNQINSGNGLIVKREIVMAVVLSFITCGIYGIYWFIVMTDDANKVSGQNETSGIMAFVFSLLTCGIYAFYWNYKIGKQVYEAGIRRGKNISDNSILYLILSLFGLSIVNYCLIQSDLNRFAD